MKPTLIIGGALALACLAAHAQLAGPTALNDSGMVLCDDADRALTTECAGTGQDGASGRDAAYPAGANGQAGFKYVKLDAEGRALPRDAAAWRCVGDLVTGLVWEMKTADDGPSGSGRLYTNLGNNAKDDASKLVATLDAGSVCGATNWRLPTFNELQGLVDYGVAGGPQIDTAWFPNTADNWYWSSTGYAGDSRSAWGVDFAGGDGRNRRSSPLGVRLVHDSRRSPPPGDPATRYTFASDEVTDTWTHLVWKRCVAGLVYNGGGCGGFVAYAGWMGALAAANAEAAATGVAWRLPNIKELSSMMDRTRTFPAVDTTVFPNGYVTGYAWTSTPSAADSTQARILDLCCGTSLSYPIAQNLQLSWRLVRDQ